MPSQRRKSDVATAKQDKGKAKGKGGRKNKEKEKEEDHSQTQALVPGDEEEEDQENQVLEDLYKQTKERSEFEQPDPTELETIFEAELVAKRRGMDDTGLVLGKNRSRRTLDAAAKYWLEDKDKTKHRALMTAKAYKGRKRFKLKGLTKEQESKLETLVQERLAEQEQEEQMEKEMQAPQSGNTNTSSHSAPSSKNPTPVATSNVTPRSPLVQLSTPTSLGKSKREIKKNRRRSSLFKAVLTNNMPVDPVAASHSRPAVSPGPSDSSSTETLLSEGDGVRSTPRRRSKSSEPSPDPMLPNEELRRQIEEADSLFGTVARPASSAASSKGTGGGGFRRKSVVVKVRRSTRLMRTSEALSDDASMGTVYEETEVTLSKRRRRSIMDLHAATVAAADTSETPKSDQEVDEEVS